MVQSLGKISDKIKSYLSKRNELRKNKLLASFHGEAEGSSVCMIGYNEEEDDSPIKHFRVTKGVARWQGEVVEPVAEFPWLMQEEVKERCKNQVGCGKDMATKDISAGAMSAISNCGSELNGDISMNIRKGPEQWRLF